MLKIKESSGKGSELFGCIICLRCFIVPLPDLWPPICLKIQHVILYHHHFNLSNRHSDKVTQCIKPT